MRPASWWPASSASTAAMTVLVGGSREKILLEQLELRAAGRAGGACQVPEWPLLGVGVELVVAERVDGALGDNERSIVPTHDALPGRLGASGREPREANVLDFEAGDRARIIAVDEERVATRVVGPCAREAEIPQGLPAKASRMEVGARRGEACRLEHLRRRCPVSRWPRRRLRVVGQRPLGAEPLPQLLANGAERAVTAALLDEVDDRAVVAFVADREVGPVPVPVLADDDLVVGHGMPEHMARGAAFAPVALVAVAVRREVDEGNVALEAVQFVVVHGGDPLAGWRLGRTTRGPRRPRVPGRDSLGRLRAAVRIHLPQLHGGLREPCRQV